MRPRTLSDALWFGLSTLNADDRRQGIDDEIRPAGLLTAYAHIPGVTSIAPYGELVARLRLVVADPAAILPFAYGWRLSAQHNAKLLADVCTDHLSEWRRHPKGDPEARLRFVCHSMGGIIALEFCANQMGESETQQIITLGTPFGGAVKAASALGRSDLLPFRPSAGLLQRTLSSFTAMYELLPRTECLEEAGRHRCPEPEDFVSLGIDDDLTSDALGFRRELSGHLPGIVRRIDVRGVIGDGQPTPATFRITDGQLEVTAPRSGLMADGDGTVPVAAAHLDGMQTASLAQRHVALAADPGALDHVTRWLLEQEVGPRMAPPGIGLEVPETVSCGQRFTVTVHAPRRREVMIAMVDLAASATKRRERLPIGHKEGPRTVSLTAPLSPGIIKIEGRGAGNPVCESTLVQ